MSLSGHVEGMREMRNGHQIFVRKPEGKCQSGRARCAWEDNIKSGVREIG